MVAIDFFYRTIKAINMRQLFLSLLGVLALSACSKEDVEPTSSDTAQTKPVTLSLSIEGQADAGGIRAVSFDTNQNVPPTTHDQYSNWQTHCFLRKVGDDTNQAYALIDWEAKMEGGKVHLKMKGHTLTLLQSGNKPTPVPKAGERWSIVGVTGGGKLNAERTRVDFAPDTELDNNLQPHQVRVPFTFEKVFFTVSAESGERAPQISVYFKPQGSLINVYTNNKTSQAGIAELQVVTNALSNNGYYDYSSDMPSWVFAHDDAKQEAIIRRIHITPNQGRNYVLWGMPRPETTKPIEGFKSEVVVAGYQISGEGVTEEKPKIRTEAFVNALAYPVGIDIDLSLTPLNKLTTTGTPSHIVKFMSSTSNNFVDARAFDNATDIKNSDILFTQSDAIKRYGPASSTNTSPYYLPTIWELGAIFPSQRVGFSIYQSYNFADSDITVNELVQFEPGQQVAKRKRVTSSYKASGGVLYADRFKNYAGGMENNSKRTVFRYEYIKIKDLADGTALNGLKITTRYLGNDGDASGYDTENFWTDPSKNAHDVTAVFPALGHRAASTGINGYYWSSSPHASLSDVSYTMYFSFDRINSLSNGENQEAANAFGLILFPKN